jgi:hypothetical protein
VKFFLQEKNFADITKDKFSSRKISLANLFEPLIKPRKDKEHAKEENLFQL